MAMAFFFASLFKWNKFSAVTAVWISNPITAPFLYSITYITGAKILGIGKSFNPGDEFSLSMLSKILHKAPGVLWALIIGGILLGLPLAVAGYYFSYIVIKRYQDDIIRRLSHRRDSVYRKEDKITKSIKN